MSTRTAPRRTGSAASRPPRRQRHSESQVTLGIEVDGADVTAVLLVDDKVDKVLAAEGETLKARLRHVHKLAGKPARTRVALAAPGTTVTPMTMTAQMASRASFEEAAHTRTVTHPATAAVCGLFDRTDLTEGVTAPGMVAAAPLAAVAEVYGALDLPTAQVAPSAANAAVVEGLTLALRNHTTELTLVLGGRVVAQRELRVTTLAQLDGTLGQGNVVGATRIGAALRAREDDHVRVDPEAVQELSRYLRAVAAQAHAATNEWALAGHDVPRRVYAHGRGATSPQLAAALAAVGLVRHNGNGLENALTMLEPTVRGSVVGAYLAARGYRNDAATDAFPNPVAVRAAQAWQARQRRTRRTRTLAWATALTAAGALAPLAVSAADQLSAREQADTQIQQTAEHLGVPLSQVRSALSLARSESASVPGSAFSDALLAASAHGTLGMVQAEDGAAHLRLEGVADPQPALAALEEAGFAVTASTHTAATATLDVTVRLTGGSR